MRRCIPFITAFLILLAAAAPARQPDGTLDLIRLPNSGVPAITLSGGRFEAVLKAESRLQLRSESGGTALACEWKPLPGGWIRAVCAVPEDTPPGLYTLEALFQDRRDQNRRAVCVRPDFPEYYIAAHISDTHIGKDGRHPRKSDEIIRDLFAALNKTEADFALITGDLTENGTPDQFQRFLDLLDTCRMPTFVCAGNHDRQALHYENFFGPLTYHFRFGEDGYLVFDTKDYIMADDTGARDGLLQRFRRELIACRWTIGVTHRYESMMGMRSQLTLFVDNPLDFLVFGHWHRENTAEEAAVPWGKTAISVVPAAIDGKMRLFDMTASGPIPRPVMDAASVDVP
jgi:predicted phosphodiesterase